MSKLCSECGINKLQAKTIHVGGTVCKPCRDKIVHHCIEEGCNVQTIGENVRCSFHAHSMTRKGCKITEEHKKKISAANKGRKLSKEHRAKISKSKKGRKMHPRTQAILIECNRKRKGTKRPKSFGEKISKALKGRKMSDKARHNMSESRKKFFANGGKTWIDGLTKDTDDRRNKRIYSKS